MVTGWNHGRGAKVAPLNVRVRQSGTVGKITSPATATFSKPLRKDTFLLWFHGTHANGQPQNVMTAFAGRPMWLVTQQNYTLGRAEVYGAFHDGDAQAASYSITIARPSNDTHGYAEIVVPPWFEGRLKLRDGVWYASTGTNTQTFGPVDEDCFVIVGANAYQDHSGVLTMSAKGITDPTYLTMGSGYYRVALGVVRAGQAVKVTTYDTYFRGYLAAFLR